MNFISLPRPEHSTKVKISVISMFHSKNWTMISLDSRFGNVRPDKEQQKHLQVGIYELQPKFSAVESSIRDIFFFWKSSCGLENDNTLFKNWWLGTIYIYTKYWPWPIQQFISQYRWGFPIAIFEIICWEIPPRLEKKDDIGWYRYILRYINI